MANLMEKYLSSESGEQKEEEVDVTHQPPE
jgi:hypothetical protein